MSGQLQGWTIVFDLDGTLIDTAPDLVATANAVLVERGFDAVLADVLRPVISFGSRRMLQAALAHQQKTLPVAEVDAMFEDFLVYYRANIADHSRPFPHLRETLTGLAGDGASLAVCTNKLERLSLDLLQALDLVSPFRFIAGRDTFPISKPDPGHLIGAIEGAGGDPSHAIMVGDSDVDVETAKAAGVPIIGVTFGYTPIPIRDLGCDAVIDSYAEFRPALGTLLTRADPPQPRA